MNRQTLRLLLIVAGMISGFGGLAIYAALQKKQAEQQLAATSRQLIATDSIRQQLLLDNQALRKALDECQQQPLQAQ